MLLRVTFENVDNMMKFAMRENHETVRLTSYREG